MQRPDKADGFTILETVVVLAIMALVLAVIVPRLTSRPLHLTADTEELAANLQVTRGLARSRAELGGNPVRYRLRVLSTTQYAIELGVLTGGTWTYSAERTVTLRPDIAFDAGSVGQSAAFDSRSRLVGSAVTFRVEDGARGWSRQLVVRTTGIVEIQ